MSRRARLAALEHALRGGGDVVLTMADGTQQTIPIQRGDGILNLCHCCMEFPQSPEAELIRRSVTQTEPSGGRMIELAWAMLNSPAEPSEPEPQQAIPWPADPEATVQ